MSPQVELRCHILVCGIKICADRLLHKTQTLFWGWTRHHLSGSGGNSKLRMPKDRHDSIQKYVSTGAVEHELSAVMVHRGTAYGGASYLYCRDYSFENDVVWVRLSDWNTREAQFFEIEATFGGVEDSPATACGLLYRDCDFVFHTKLGLYPS